MKEVIELSDQSTRRSSKDEHPKENQTAPSFGPISNDSSHSLNHTATKIPSEDPPLNIPSGDAPVSKKGFLEKIKSKIPPLPLLRIVVKSSIAILIALLFVFETRCRTAMGGAAILVPIGTLLNFPIRTIGVQIESTVQSLVSALCGAAWSFLAMYLANLARDHNNPIPVQPSSSAILAIFMLIGVFGLTYVRTKFAQANFATIFASMIVGFSLTQASVTPGFQPVIIYTFLKPIATASAIALGVDMFLWPEDSLTKYLGLLGGTLKEFNNFFEEHSNAFLSPSSEVSPSLPTLHARLQNSVLKLIDAKRELQREVILNKLSHDDIRSITRLVKMMRLPLHGIGLSQLMKSERLQKTTDPFANSKEFNSEERRELVETVREMRSVAQELSDTCVATLSACNDRLMKYCLPTRSWTSTIFWPFPRIFISDYRKAPENLDSESSQSLSDRLDNVIGRFEEKSKHTSYLLSTLSIKDYQQRFDGPVQNILLFHYSILQHANQLRSFVACVENIDVSRTRRRLWFPQLAFKKWFRSMDVNPNIGVNISSNTGQPGTSTANTGGNDLTLSKTMTNTNPNEFAEEANLVGSRSQRGTIYPRDPDVNPPETTMERFFYQFHKIFEWFQSMETIFALKCATGFVLLSLPAFFAQSSGWFFQWRGQWATITLMMWMIPIAGMFFLTIILRVAGTIMGGVLGIIVWEITRGNPYGLVILTFFLLMPLYYLFFTSQVLNIVAIMTKVTLLLVICYEYQYVVGGTTGYDSVELVAGKRMFLVVIGVLAAAILSMIPSPVTGRVELRKRISKTIHDLSKLYGILVGDLLTDSRRSNEPTARQIKAFRKLALGIQRQIADERTYLKLSKMEPPLRGKFPLDSYTRLVEKVDNMADLLEGMAYASRSVDKSWQRSLIDVIKAERMEHLASVLSMMKLLSSTLASKMAMPPFMMSPLEERNRFAEKLRNAISAYPKEINNETFPSYCAYAVNSYKFCGELHEVLECVEELVGVEDPEQWLLLYA
ncbi:hypothetical protein K501DRAFT_260071 [Backusella circina FSU 941]|nr:hypothetical protein K501DRAFT_260071 [Backusella circina FSU 941]